MDVFFSGSWRKTARAEIYIGGVWRRISRGETYRSSVWRSCLSFGTTLTLWVSPERVTGLSDANTPTRMTITSNPTTALPSGGSSPYSYVWTAPGVSVTSPGNATTGFYAILNPGQDLTGTAEVTCTDAAGNVATGNAEYYLYNDSGNPV